MFSYVYQNTTHQNSTQEYMTGLGMTAEQIESVLRQKEFELPQNIEKRKAAYRAESDHLYMEWQYDQTPEAEQAWRDKVQEIKARYPLE